jgi:hypothetical protein
MEDFLQLCGITPEQFTTLTVPERAALVQQYLASPLAKTPPSTMPRLTRSESPINTEHLGRKRLHEDLSPMQPSGGGKRVRDEEPMLIEDLKAQAEQAMNSREPDLNLDGVVSPEIAYNHLRSLDVFLTLGTVLTNQKFQRSRVRWPEGSIQEGDLLDPLSKEQVLWLQRLDAVRLQMVGDSKQCVSNMLEVLHCLFSREVLVEFHRFMSTKQCTIKAMTKYKGYYCLISTLQSYFGKSFSRLLDMKDRDLARNAVCQLQDDARTFCQAASNEITTTEARRLKAAMQTSQCPVEQRLIRLYLLLFTERFWFLHAYNSITPSTSQMSRAVGFVVAATLLARPHSRPELLRHLTIEDVQCQLLEMKDKMSFVFTQHKTVRTFHSIVAKMAAHLAEIFTIYDRVIRPTLFLCGQWRGDRQLLFPSTLYADFELFLTSCGVANVTCGVVRRWFCEAVDLLPSTHRFYEHKTLLQASAAHCLDSRTITMHYNLSKKPRDEKIVQEFIDFAFVSPAKRFVYQELIQLAARSDDLNLPTSTAVSSSCDMISANLSTPSRLVECTSTQAISLPQPSVDTKSLLSGPRLELNDESDSGTDPSYVFEEDLDLSPDELYPSFVTPRAATTAASPKRTTTPKSSSGDKTRPHYLCSELKTLFKQTLTLHMRTNLFFGKGNELRVIVCKHLDDQHMLVDNAYGRLSPFDNETLRATALSFCRNTLKSWRSILPTKQFAGLLIDEDVQTIGQLKQLLTLPMIKNALSRHPAFRNVVPSAHVVSQIRKCSEQRMFAIDDTIAYNIFLNYRRGGLFPHTRLEHTEVQDVDTTTFLQRDF